ncbi:DUF72 domain-containing protein [Fructilactobacillus florum]|nr:DUF72 domain-containing protein [Fructilactobacillus florum]
MTMIKVGLTTWTDHPFLSSGKKQKITLSEYARDFSLVEIDSSFYRIPPQSWVTKWQTQVSADFQFIVKANYAMTKTPLPHAPQLEGAALAKLFTELEQAVSPLVAANQLQSLLFQFPPSFTCNVTNVQYLQAIRKRLPQWPIAVEFRHASWFANSELTHDTLSFLAGLNYSNVVVDEPHAHNNGVPLVPIVTNPKLAFVRLHGRNEVAWAEGTRERYRYRYQPAELAQLTTIVQRLEQQASQVVVIFNNNAGKDAAPNALELKRKLHQEPNGGSLEQLNLF